jgi:hypothetical protein
MPDGLTSLRRAAPGDVAARTGAASGEDAVRGNHRGETPANLGPLPPFISAALLSRCSRLLACAVLAVGRGAPKVRP